MGTHFLGGGGGQRRLRDEKLTSSVKALTGPKRDCFHFALTGYLKCRPGNWFLADDFEKIRKTNSSRSGGEDERRAKLRAFLIEQIRASRRRAPLAGFNIGLSCQRADGTT